MSKLLLEVKNLRISFAGKEVVHGIDFQLAPGEKLALVGESGSGKTITALSLLRLVQNAAVSGAALFESPICWRLRNAGCAEYAGKTFP